MNNNSEPILDLITNKHLQDPKSDSLYEPFRDVSYQSILKRTNYIYNQKDDFVEALNNSKIPHNLKKLQIAYQPINPLKKMKKVGQRQKQYPAISQKVFLKLIQNNNTQIITYKYGTIGQNISQISNKSKKLRCISLQRKDANEYKFKQRLQKLKELKKQVPKYNLFSVIDHPINSKIKNSIFSCGDCANQIIANERQLIWQQK